MQGHQRPADGAAVPDIALAQACRRLDLRPDLLERHGRLSIQDQPEGPFVGVDGDQDHRLREIGVEETLSGDQEMALK